MVDFKGHTNLTGEFRFGKYRAFRQTDETPGLKKWIIRSQEGNRLAFWPTGRGAKEENKEDITEAGWGPEKAGEAECSQVMAP